MERARKKLPTSDKFALYMFENVQHVLHVMSAVKYSVRGSVLRLDVRIRDFHSIKFNIFYFGYIELSRFKIFQFKYQHYTNDTLPCR